MQRNARRGGRKSRGPDDVFVDRDSRGLRELDEPPDARANYRQILALEARLNEVSQAPDAVATKHEGRLLHDLEKVLRDLCICEGRQKKQLSRSRRGTHGSQHEAAMLAAFDETSDRSETPGEISREQCAAFMKDRCMLAIAPHQFQGMWTALANKTTDTVNFSGFVQVFASCEREQLRTEFRNMDANKDNKISRAELKVLLQQFGVPGVRSMSEEQVWQSYVTTDYNHDGELDFEEFEATYSNIVDAMRVQNKPLLTCAGAVGVSQAVEDGYDAARRSHVIVEEILTAKATLRGQGQSEARLQLAQQETSNLKSALAHNQSMLAAQRAKLRDAHILLDECAQEEAELQLACEEADRARQDKVKEVEVVVKHTEEIQGALQQAMHQLAKKQHVAENMQALENKIDSALETIKTIAGSIDDEEEMEPEFSRCLLENTKTILTGLESCISSMETLPQLISELLFLGHHLDKLNHKDENPLNLSGENAHRRDRVAKWLNDSIGNVHNIVRTQTLVLCCYHTISSRYHFRCCHHTITWLDLFHVQIAAITHALVATPGKQLEMRHPVDHRNAAGERLRHAGTTGQDYSEESLSYFSVMSLPPSSATADQPERTNSKGFEGLQTMHKHIQQLGQEIERLKLLGKLTMQLRQLQNIESEIRVREVRETKQQLMRTLWAETKKKESDLDTMVIRGKLRPLLTGYSAVDKAGSATLISPRSLRVQPVSESNQLNDSSNQSSRPIKHKTASMSAHSTKLSGGTFVRRSVGENHSVGDEPVMGVDTSEFAAVALDTMNWLSEADSKMLTWITTERRSSDQIQRKISERYKSQTAISPTPPSTTQVWRLDFTAQQDTTIPNESSLVRDSVGNSLVHALGRALQREGKMFVDDDFPPNSQNSLKRANDEISASDVFLETLDDAVVWKRASQIKPVPPVVWGSIDPDDIQQGCLGDCYYL
eukprot:SAG31_NODE_1764_length_7320_cov_3.114112_4_plen_947_part_00